MTNAKIEVLDCANFVTFSNVLLSSYEQRKGGTFPSINGHAVSSFFACGIDTSTYQITPAFSAVTFATSGVATVSTASTFSAQTV